MLKDIFPFYWQILSQLDIIIRLEMLLDIFIKVVQNSSEFSEGVATMFPFPLFTVQSPLTQTEGSHMATPVSGVPSELGELSSNLSCFIMELDLLVKQVISSSFNFAVDRSFFVYVLCSFPSAKQREMTKI